MRDEVEFQFEREISVYRGPKNVERINMIRKGNLKTLCQIITSVKLVDSDGKKLSRSDFIFSDSVCLEDMWDIEGTPWYYDQESVVYFLPATECHYSLLYFRPCIEDQLIK